MGLTNWLSSNGFALPSPPGTYEKEEISLQCGSEHLRLCSLPFFPRIYINKGKCIFFITLFVKERKPNQSVTSVLVAWNFAKQLGQLLVTLWRWGLFLCYFVDSGLSRGLSACVVSCSVCVLALLTDLWAHPCLYLSISGLSSEAQGGGDTPSLSGEAALSLLTPHLRARFLLNRSSSVRRGWGRTNTAF